MTLTSANQQFTKPVNGQTCLPDQTRTSGKILRIGDIAGTPGERIRNG
jgi:hypothetical protein